MFEMGERNSDIISASEIGQFKYCSAAWHLKKMGYEPASPLLEVGTKKHDDLGRILEKTEKNSQKSNIFAVLGFVFLAITVLIIVFGGI